MLAPGSSLQTWTHGLRLPLRWSAGRHRCTVRNAATFSKTPAQVWSASVARCRSPSSWRESFAVPTRRTVAHPQPSREDAHKASVLSTALVAESRSARASIALLADGRFGPGDSILSSIIHIGMKGAGSGPEAASPTDDTKADPMASDPPWPWPLNGAGGIRSALRDSEAWEDSATAGNPTLATGRPA